VQQYQNVLQDKFGNVIVGASVAVYVYGTTTPATIYSGNGTGLLPSNTVTTSSLGEFAFYAANGRYSLSITATNFVAESYSDFILYDPADIGAVTASSVAFTPFGTVAATNVQNAIQEVVTDLSASSGSSLVGFLQSGTGAVARTTQAKLRDTVSVKDFGAVGDGVTDDTAAVQAAFNYIQTYGGKLLIDGNCAISSPLTILAGAKWIIEGGGGGLQGALKAIASMNWLIDMSNSSGTYEGEMTIRDLYLNGNNLSGGINANHARYSKFENLRISQIEATKTGIKAGNWVNRITNCVITDGNKAVHLYSPSFGYFNNFVIDKNAFSSAFGIYVDAAIVLGNAQYPNNVIVRDNTFDACTKAAIFAGTVSRGFIITGNYIEACGGSAVSVETSAGVFANRYGAIILPRNINVGSIGWGGLRIYDNEFVTVCQTAPSGFKYCINIEKPTDVSIYDNFVYPTGTYDGFIGLSGVGATEGDVYNFTVKHADPENILSTLIKNDVTTSTGFGNFRAKFINVAGSQQLSLPDIFANVASWAATGAMTVTQTFSNGLNVINFNRTVSAAIYYEETDANRLKMWHNRYLRFNGINAFVTPVGGNNLSCRAEIDTGSGYVTVLNVQRTDNGPVTTGSIFFVPPTTTKLKITVFPTLAGEINVYNLKLVDTGSDF